MLQLHAFATWLANTPLSLAFQNAAWVVPTSQSIHILCVSVVFASAAIIDLRLLGIGATGRTVSELVDTLIPWMWSALALLFVTGTVQTIAEPLRQFVTPVFWAKMIMILIVAIMTLIFSRKVRANAAAWDAAGTRPPTAKAFALISLILWIAIIVCGRFIGYTWSLYA
jgi:hypothetical protein